MNTKLPLAQNLEELLDLLNVSEKPAAVRKKSPATTRRLETVRKRIPQPVLDHFERMRIRGRKPVAPVCHAVCMACHLQIPKSHIVSMRRSGQIDICDHCGAFIYLDETDGLNSSGG